MKIIFCFLLLLMCSVANSAMWGRSQPVSLMEIWCGLDIRKKLLPRQHLLVGASREIIYATEKGQPYPLNTTCVEGGLYLTMMRANEDGAKWWQQFAHEQWASLVQRCRFISEKDRGMVDALNKFKEKLTTTTISSEALFRERYKGSVFAQPEEESMEGWIVFASTVDPWSKTFQSFDIEMFMSVSASPRLPLALHIGIARSLNYQGEKHSNLSVKLHEYAYQVLNNTPGHNKHQGSRYIFVRPLRVMCDILLRALPEGTVSVGTKET
ncbi:MAG: hypothetical protein H6925_00420 [Holosporaceae bacterium]|nr:MAG: hypothetical protein H6925_00420 [Holosporaceae bacterium]